MLTGGLMCPVVQSDGIETNQTFNGDMKMDKKVQNLISVFNGLNEAEQKEFRAAIRTGRQSGEWDLSANPVGVSKSKSGSSWVILPYDGKIHRTKITDFGQLIKTLAKGCQLLPLYSGNRDKDVAADLSSAKRLIVSRYVNRDYGTRLPLLLSTTGHAVADKPAVDVPDSL